MEYLKAEILTLMVEIQDLRAENRNLVHEITDLKKTFADSLLQVGVAQFTNPMDNDLT